MAANSPFPNIGDFEIVESARDNGGTRTIIRRTLPHGAHGSAHYHEAFSETFRIVSGVVRVRVNGKAERYGEGQAVTVPPRAVHTYRVTSPDGAIIDLVLEPGCAAFEDALVIADELHRDPEARHFPTAKKLQIRQALTDMSDLYEKGFIGAIVGVLTRRQDPKAIQELKSELIVRYVRKEWPNGND